MYTYIIPISLFVTIELARLGQATYMSLDPKMEYNLQDLKIPMRASNSNLNEDLGRVDFIFSDKTGTFTQNSMVMANWFVEGLSLDEMAHPGILNKTLRVYFD
jgi:P-type E1-E2 ATPase